MTDQEIIQAFIDNNQSGIRWAYYAWQSPFWSSVKQRTNLDEDYREDAYQEAFIRLQQHILTGRLTSDNLSCSVLAYLKGIGYYAAMEIIRGRRELPITLLRHATSNDDDEVSESNNESDEETTEALREGAYDPMAHYYEEERERIIREQVMLIGKPCAPLLQGFYWDDKSMETLAIELGYSNADSAKAQKAKCMNKVKTFVKQKLIAYGYGYKD